MLARLHQVGIQGKAWRVVKDMYREVRSRVKLHGGHSAWWNCAQGVRQGSVLSPLLFSITINSLIDRLNKHPGVKLGDEKITCLLFADDVVLIAPTELRLRKALK